MVLQIRLQSKDRVTRLVMACIVGAITLIHGLVIRMSASC